MKGLTEDAGVMAWRPSCTERIPALLGHYLVYGLYGSAGGYQRGLPSFLGGDRVLIVKVTNDFVPRPLQLRYPLHHLLDVVEVVDFENVGNFGSLLHILFKDEGRWRRGVRLAAAHIFVRNKLDSVRKNADLLID